MTETGQTEIVTVIAAVTAPAKRALVEAAAAAGAARTTCLQETVRCP